MIATTRRGLACRYAAASSVSTATQRSRKRCRRAARETRAWGWRRTQKYWRGSLWARQGRPARGAAPALAALRNALLSLLRVRG